MSTPPVRILIADDAESTLALYRMVFEDWLPAALQRPVEIIAVLDGCSACDALREQPFDVAILDMHMGPRGCPDGYELGRLIRGKGSAALGDGTPQNVIVIAWSAHNPDAHGEGMAAIDAFADPYYAKPVEPRAIVSALARLLDREAR